jgi:hypothetical protein
LFGTQLFNADDIADTKANYRISTIVVSISTYLIAIILILVAGKLGFVRWGYDRLLSTFSNTRARAKGKKHDLEGEDAGQDADHNGVWNGITRLFSKARGGPRRQRKDKTLA